MYVNDGERAIRWSEREQAWEVMLFTGRFGLGAWFTVGRYSELAGALQHFTRLAAGKVKGY